MYTSEKSSSFVKSVKNSDTNKHLRAYILEQIQKCFAPIEKKYRITIFDNTDTADLWKSYDINEYLTGTEISTLVFAAKDEALRIAKDFLLRSPYFYCKV